MAKRLVIMSEEFRFVAAVACVMASLLGGCSSNASLPSTESTASFQGTAPADAPITLGSQQPVSGGLPATMALPLPADRVAQALAIFRTNNHLPPGPAQWAGADLNGDGTAEAVALLPGGLLVVMRQEPQGLRPVSSTRGVSLPIRMADEAADGWRDLITGDASGHSVRLGFTTTGYPGSTLGQPRVEDASARPELALTTTEPASAPVAANGQLPLASGADASEGMTGQ